MPRGCRVVAASVAALAACALAATTACAADAPAGLQFESGSLTAVVQSDPFLVDFGGLSTLAGAGGLAPDDPRGKYGTFGYAMDRRQPVVNNAYLGYYEAAEANTLWFHATRVASSELKDAKLRIVADTNDPLGNQLEIVFSSPAEGVIAVETAVIGPLAGLATTSGVAFQPKTPEHYLGFGERSNSPDQTGNHVFTWAEEGPFSSGDYEHYTDFVPASTSPPAPPASTLPIPWVVSTRGIGVLIDRPERSYFNLL